MYEMGNYKILLGFMVASIMLVFVYMKKCVIQNNTYCCIVNGMKRMLSLLGVLFVVNSVCAQIRGGVCDENGSPMVGATVSVLEIVDQTYIAGTTSDMDGNFVVSPAVDSCILEFSYVGYASHRILCKNIKSNMNIGMVVMQPALTEIRGVEIKGNNHIRKIDHQVILPTKLQMKASTNGISLLNNLQLPGISINLMDKTIGTVLGEEVGLRINGRKADWAEIKSIRPEAVLRIEFHDSPGLRYENAGAIINVVLKEREDGGNVALDVTNGVTKLGIGDYEWSGNYHMGNSNLKMIMSWERRDLKWVRENSEAFNGTSDPIINKEIGMETKVKYDHLDMSFCYDYSIGNDMLSIALRNRYSDTPNSISDRLSQLINGDCIYDVVDLTNSKEKIPSLNIYYQKKMSKGRNLYLDLLGTYIDSKVHRFYSQSGEDAKTEIISSTKGDKYSIIGEAIYEKEWEKCKLSMGVRHSQMYTSNKYDGTIVSRVSMNTANTYGYVEFSSKVKRLNYLMGIGGMRVYSSQGINCLENYIFRPTIKLSYRIKESMYLQYRGYISGYSPSLSDLNDVSQNIDVYQLRRGNPIIKPVSFCSNEFSVNWNMKGFNIEGFARYSYDHKPIMEQTLFENGKYVRTIDNQKAFHRLNSQLNIKIQPYSGHISIQLSPFFNRFISMGSYYLHTHSNWGFHGSVIGMYKNWVVAIDGETSRHNLWGETLTKGETSHSFAVGYNKESWGVQLQMQNPFTKTYRQSVENRSQLAPYSQFAYSKDLKRIVMLNFYCSLDFGKRKEEGTKKINNNDNDSGILSGAK